MPIKLRLLPVDVMVACVSLAILACVGTLGCSKVKRYDSGDAAIEDRGFLSYYPRYRIELPPLPVADSGFKYTIKSCPRNKFSLWLIVDDGDSQLSNWSEWKAARENLKSDAVKVSIKIHRVVDDQEWSFDTTLADMFWGRHVNEFYFQPEKLEDLALEGEVWVEIDLYVSRSGASSNMFLRPVLLGGGIEI